MHCISLLVASGAESTCDIQVAVLSTICEYINPSKICDLHKKFKNNYTLKRNGSEIIGKHCIHLNILCMKKKLLKKNKPKTKTKNSWEPCSLQNVLFRMCKRFWMCRSRHM